MHIVMSPQISKLKTQLGLFNCAKTKSGETPTLHNDSLPINTKADIFNCPFVWTLEIFIPRSSPHTKNNGDKGEGRTHSHC